MSRRKRGRGRRKKKDDDEEEEKDPMPSIASLVTTPQTNGRVECLSGIVNQLKLLWTGNAEDLPDDEVWPTSAMLELYRAPQPCFELARLAAISVKNTLCAVLLSKLEELHEAAMPKINSENTDESVQSVPINDTVPGFTNELLLKVEETNTIARLAIIGFVFDRCSSMDEEVKRDSCDALLKKRKMVRRFIQFCRDDTVTDISKFGQKLLWRLVSIPKAKMVVAGYGGGEALITSFLAWLKRVRTAQSISEEHETDFNHHCEEVANRKKEVNMCKEKNELARIQAMRGLRQAKIDFEKTKETLASALGRLEAAGIHYSSSQNRLSEVAKVQAQLEQHMLMLLSSLGLITVGPDYDMQSVMHRYGVVDCVVDMIHRCAVDTDKAGYAEMRKQALIVVGNFANRFPPIQNTLRNEGLLPIILNELNRPQPPGDSTYTVMVSNVLYKCIDGNPESGEAVCNLGILGGLCRMLHALYHEIVHGDDDGDDDEDGEKEKENEGNEKDSDKEEEKEEPKETEEEKAARLSQSEASLRVLAECSRSSESRREEILNENVLLPLLTLAATPNVPRIVFVSLKCLGNLIAGHKPTQDTIVTGDVNGVGSGLAVMCSILGQVRSEVRDIVETREANGLLEPNTEDERSLSENIAFEAQRCMRLVIEHNERSRTEAMNGIVLTTCCELIEHRSSDAMRRDACKILSAILGGDEVLNQNTIGKEKENKKEKEKEKNITNEKMNEKIHSTSSLEKKMETNTQFVVSKYNNLYDTCLPNRTCQDLLFENGVLPHLLRCVVVPNPPDIADEDEDSEEDSEENIEEEKKEEKNEEKKETTNEDVLSQTEDESEKGTEDKIDTPTETGDQTKGTTEEEEPANIISREKPMNVLAAMRSSAAKTIGRLVRNHTALKDYACRIQHTPVGILRLINFAEPMQMVRPRILRRSTSTKAVGNKDATKRNGNNKDDIDKYICQLGARWSFPEGTFPRVRIEAALALAWCIEGAELLGKQQALRADALQKLIMLNGAATLPERVAAAVALERLCHNSALAREDFRRLGTFQMQTITYFY